MSTNGVHVAISFGSNGWWSVNAIGDGDYRDRYNRPMIATGMAKIVVENSPAGQRLREIG
jgi:hypothetical protein